MNSRISKALRVAGRFAGGGDVPLSDSGPLPGQEWPDTYDPEGAERFAGILGDTGMSALRAVAPPIPGFNHPTISEGAQSLRSKVEGKPGSEVFTESLQDFAGEAIPTVAMSLAPIGGRAVGKALEVATRPLRANPKAAAAGLAGAGVLATPGTAQSPEGDPREAEVKALSARIAAKQAELQKMATVKFQSTVARQLASQPILDQIKADQDRISEIRTSAENEAKGRVDAQAALEGRQLREAQDARQTVRDNAPKPFNEEFPNWRKVQPFVPAGLGFATGLLPGIWRGIGDRIGRSRWQAAVDRAMNTTSQTQRDRSTAVAKNYADDWAPSTFKKELSGYGMPVTVGALEGAIAPSIPEGYNLLSLSPENTERKGMEAYLRSLPEGHPERARAEAQMSGMDKTNPVRDASLEYFKDWRQFLPRTAAGVVEGAGGAAFGHTIGKLTGPAERTLPRAQTSALVDEAAARAQSQPLALPPQRPLSGGPLTSTASPSSQDLPPAPRLPAPQSRPAKPEESPSTQSSSTSSPRVILRTTDKLGRKHFRSEDGKYTSKPKKGESPDEGFSSGGAVQAALRVVRRAFGGAVKSGLLHSDVPGRTDHLPMNVKSGSYIMPADTVSALGEGNTLAGAKKLDALLKTGPYGTPMPKPQKAAKTSMFKFSKKADGGAVDVPILAAGGEYQIAPEDVARLGGGDVEAGHRALDDIVRRVRANNIALLSSLPGPEK